MPKGLSISLISSASIGLKKVPTCSARMAITMMMMMMWMLMAVMVVVMTSMMIMMILISIMM